MRFILKHAALAAACLAAFPAHATNGYFLPGFGFRSQGMGGVGIAYGRDSLSAAANPANAVNTGMRGDLGFGVFNPERSGRVFNDPATPVVGFGFTGNSESNGRYFIVPEMGFTMPLNDQLHVGLAVVGNGGMNTNYPENFFASGTVPRDKKLGVDLNQLLVPITAAFKVNERHAVGASLVLAETRFRAYGLDSFVNFDSVFPITSDPAHLTNQGFDYSYGAGIKLGWLGSFMDDRLTVGLAYASRTYMSKFDKYRGLFAEQGDFDIPENYGIGIAIKPKKNLVIAADILHIKYSDVASIGNPGMCVTTGPIPSPGFCIPSVTDPTKELGNDNGMGFGWEDQTVYKLGIQYGVNKRLQVRAGYNYGKSPIPDDPNFGGDNAVTFNLLAPGTVEHHYSMGFTYRANDNLEVTGTYMYAANNAQSSGNLNIIDHGDFNMHQNLFALTFGWVLDPGPVALDEYGEEDWEGINFDGWYAGLGVGQSNFRNVDADSANTRSEGWKVYAGYQFNKYLGIEGGYVNLNDMTATTGAVRTNMNADAWALGAVLSYPVTEKISLMGKVGAAYLLSDIKRTDSLSATGDDSFEPNYGVGVSYAVFDNLNLRAEWERFDRDDLNIDLVSAGVALKF